VEHPILLKATEDKIVASTGLDFLTPIAINVVSEAEYWEKNVCTFRLRGTLPLCTLLEVPDLKDCFNTAKVVHEK
jgi:hypothetical protein